MAATRKAEIVQLRLKGLSYREIGDIVGLSGERVRQILDEENDSALSRARRRQNDARNQKILALHHQGLTQQAIAAELGMKSYTAVGQVIRDAGLCRYREQRERDGINDERIAQLKAQGCTYRQIADTLGIEKLSAVYAALKRKGLVVPLNAKRAQPEKA